MGYFSSSERLKAFQAEVIKEKENYILLQEKVKEILKEDNYEGIYNYFYGILTSDYDFIILMSRRCLVLCQIFLAFFVLDGQLLDSDCIALSDQAIPYYRKRMCGQKVVIVDDILIHGRTVSNTYDLLYRYCKMTKPEIRVYMADTDIDCLRDEVRKAMKAECVGYKGEWRNLSNKIVKCIYASNTPYTSFVTAFFEYASSNLFEQIRNIKELHIEDNTELMQEACGLKSYYCYEDTVVREPLFETLSLGECVRIYWNKDISKLTVIPYVFVRSMDVKTTQQILDRIREVLPEQTRHMKTILGEEDECVKDKELLLEYKMRLITCIMSNLYWKKFTERYQLPSASYMDVDTLEKSFGGAVAKELQMLFEQEFGELRHLESSIPSGDGKVEAELSEILDTVCDNGREVGCKDLMKRYFQKAWYLDECRAQHEEERMSGLPLESFMECAEGHKIHPQMMFMNLVNSWDTGIAAANYAVANQGSHVACFNTPGEQSYKIILEKYPYLMSVLIYVSKIIKKYDNGKVLSPEEYAVYREKKLIELLDRFHEVYVLEDYDDIKGIISQEKGYLNAWNQVGVFRAYMQQDLNQDEGLVRDFIEQNL